MYESPKFWARGDGGDFLSLSLPGALSPAYTVVWVARQRIEKGRILTLPRGYDLETLKRISWILGTYDVQQRIDARQAFELGCIARELLAAHAASPFLTSLQVRDIEQVAPQD